MGIKDVGTKISNKLDITCDKCGKLMKPGGGVKKTIDGKEYQFCCDKCAGSFDPKKDKVK
jgi:YHS domain-containing protein